MFYMCNVESDAFKGNPESVTIHRQGSG